MVTVVTPIRPGTRPTPPKPRTPSPDTTDECRDDAGRPARSVAGGVGGGGQLIGRVLQQCRRFGHERRRIALDLEAESHERVGLVDRHARLGGLAPATSAASAIHSPLAPADDTPFHTSPAICSTRLISRSGLVEPFAANRIAGRGQRDHIAACVVRQRRCALGLHGGHGAASCGVHSKCPFSGADHYHCTRPTARLLTLVVRSQCWATPICGPEL